VSPQSRGSPDITAVIAAHNESANIEACIASVEWAREVIVVENDSVDDTIDRAKGAGATVTKTEHRIEPVTVQQEVTAAGFKLVRTSDVLANPADNHTERNAEADIRGKTDRFIYVFQKP